MRKPFTTARSSIRRRAGISRRSKDFTSAIGIAPSSAEPYNGRGLSYLALGDAKTALDDINESLNRDKTSYLAWTNQGLALEQLGDKKQARAAFAHATQLNPKYAPARDGMRRTG
jgi:Tfp pilus assembly protein PilF